jgi:polyisoprenoid-binding protein YceI
MPRAALAWALASGIGVLLVAAGGGPSKAPLRPLSLGSERAASAQTADERRYHVVAEGSEVRYRVREQLAGLDFPNDAIGATSAIDGGVALDARGRVVTRGSRFLVDLRTLRSDKARRDNYLRRNTLETDRHPTVTFVPVEVRGLAFPLPRSGTAAGEIVGDLTVRDTTRRVTWAATVSFDGQDVRVRATTVFRFEEFGLRVPRVSVVLSVEDHIQLEADVLLRPSS